MRRIVLVLCAAEVLTMVGIFAFPALLPAFQQQWTLTGTEAGWISGITFAGYALVVPVLTAMTDRVDARWVYLGGAAMAAISALGFALIADGFWSAMVFRALAGMGLAGTYMPGLRALVDRTSGPRQPHWMSWYTASFSLGTSLSFLLAGLAAALMGWRAAYGAAALLSMVAVGLVAFLVKPVAPPPAPEPRALLDFRPVLRNRPVLGYVLGYTAHMWELFGLRSWMVAFLVFVAGFQAGETVVSPTVAATIASLVAVIGSIGGADLAVRFDRRRLCIIAAVLSGSCALGLGFLASWPYAVVVAVVVLYNGLVQLDSAALTTGAVLGADPAHRGATIAVHSLAGFAAGFVAPLAFGWILDRAGGAGEGLAWGLAFASMGAVALLGPLALAGLRQR